MDGTKNRILKATCQAVRRYGLDGVRIQNISELAGLSPGALYRYFDSKEMLLAECFYQVDRQAAQIFDQVNIDWERLRKDPIGEGKDLWVTFFRFWTARPDETVFYNNFRNSPAFRELEQEMDNRHLQKVNREIERFMELFPELRKVNHTLLRIHLLNATVMYAKCVVQGILPDNEQTANEIFSLLTGGLSGFLKL